ncbi:hypothetical protein VTN77DRAFT_2875 [Rasamsonia byssochlamydoides]|uniref:uncharacterized protein n=1 Tax=Rasamsonia byssochlamydoides TaxID=89139 RepID=UPI0037426C54
MEIDGVALVIGAGSGIGREVALTLASRGASVLICADLNVEGAKQTAETCQSRAQTADFHATAIQVDVRQERDVKKLMSEAKSRFGRIDVCVNTAGFGAANQTPISSMSLDDYRQLDEVHNIGSFLVLRATLQAMLQQEPRGTGRHMSRGSIVLLTSLASEGAFLGVGNYTAAKHAVKGLVQTAALENARKGIRINAVAPSYVSGPMVNKFMEEAPAAKAAMLGDLAMGRLAEPEEVADAVVFLASSSASYINGHTLVVDGGTSLQLANTPFSG